MDLRRPALLAMTLLTGCITGGVPRSLAAPEEGPSIVIARREAVIVFPVEALDDFPRPKQQLEDPYSGPRWAMEIFLPKKKYLGIVLGFWDVDSLRIDAANSLSEAIAPAHLQRCTLDVYMMSCGTPLAGTTQVDSGRLVLHITDKSWLREMQAARPTVGRLHVSQANNNERWGESVSIRYRDD
ncbi:MAG: hypothetical protein V4558_09815 [Gemmatimonadota bacterium]